MIMRSRSTEKVNKYKSENVRGSRLKDRRLYPQQPVVGVGILINKNDRYLLIKRAAEPDAGLWSIPGGLVELGERALDAAKREAMEETGLKIRISSILDVIDRIIQDEEEQVKYHFVIIDYLAEPIGGEMKPQDDALEARWVTPKDFRKYELPPTLIALLKRLNLY
jgi:ADP-ribose pyrophosphatase